MVVPCILVDNDTFKLILENDIFNIYACIPSTLELV